MSSLVCSINIEGNENKLPTNTNNLIDKDTPEYKALNIIKVGKTYLQVYIKKNTSLLQVDDLNGNIFYTLDISKFLLEQPTQQYIEKQSDYYNKIFVVYWKQRKNFMGDVVSTQIVIHYNSGPKDEYLCSPLSISESVPLIVFNKKYDIIRKTIEWFYKTIIQKLMICTSYTELDAMPDGWRKAFGIQMCKDIKQTLIKELGYKGLFNYRISQIKEKFGGLRWYDSGGTKTINDIIDKYEDLSYNTCIVCGKPATKVSQGWICPFCDEHIGDRAYIEIEKAYPWYYNKESDNNESKETEE
jgi:hypothetical protein